MIAGKTLSAIERVDKEEKVSCIKLRVFDSCSRYVSARRQATNRFD